MNRMLIAGCLWTLALTAPPSVAQDLLESLQKGASRVTEALGDAVDTTGQAIDRATTSVTETIDSTREDLEDGKTPEETRAKLDAMAEETLTRLFTEHPEARTLFEKSAGYAVFTAVEASFYVTAGYGRGVAIDRTTQARTYMKMATVGAGLSFGLGGFQREIVILFSSPEALTRFLQQGFDSTAGVDVMAGEDKDALAWRFNDRGKAIFVLTDQGWKVAASLTGTRYWPDEALNGSAAH